MITRDVEGGKIEMLRNIVFVGMSVCEKGRIEMDYNLGSLVLSAVAILITIWVTIWGKMSEQSKQNVQLIEQFLSSDFLKDIWSVVWEIDMKWFYLPDEKREAYRQEVVSGWVGFLNGPPDEILRHEVANERLYINHHLDEVKKDYLTEHQALSIYIGFWIKLYTYYETWEISKKSLKMWKGYYDYDRRFIQDLRREILQTLASMQNYETPNWVIITGKLEKAFGY